MTLIVLIAMTFTWAQAQDPVPLPDPGAFLTELLYNPGFEEYDFGSKEPDYWKSQFTDIPGKDRVQCNKPGKPVAFSGICAYMFRGNPYPTGSSISQTILKSHTFKQGETISFSAYIDPRKTPPDKRFGVATIKLSNGSQIKLQLDIPPSDSYAKISDSVVLDLSGGKTVKKITVKFLSNQKSGKFYIDSVSLLAVAPPTPTPPNTLTPSETPPNTPLPNGLVRISPINPQLGAHFGTGVAVDGNTMAVGAPGISAVYIFTWNGTSWIEQQIIKPQMPELYDDFGYSVALHGDTLVVGAPDADGNAPVGWGGAVYIFQRTDGTFIQQEKFPGFADFANLGWSVAIDGVDGNAIAAGMPRYYKPINPYKQYGKVIYYIRNGITWTQKQQLDTNQYNYLGWAVALEGNHLAAGTFAYPEINRTGAAVYGKIGDTWVTEQFLTSTLPYTSGLFHVSVDLDDTRLAIGVPNATAGVSKQGAVDLYTWDGSNWLHEQNLLASDTDEDLRFGASVALEGDWLAVGAVEPFTEAVYLFKREGGTWVEKQKVDMLQYSSELSFGWTVEWEGTHLMIGAPHMEDDDDPGRVFWLNTASLTP